MLFSLLSFFPALRFDELRAVLLETEGTLGLVAVGRPNFMSFESSSVETNGEPDLRPSGTGVIFGLIETCRRAGVSVDTKLRVASMSNGRV